MLRCIERSIDGTIKTTIFGQAGHLLQHEDGPVLFKKITGFTSISSSQLSLASLQKIIDFNPADNKFVISTINTKLTNLFLLATTNYRTLLDSDRIQHTLNVYTKILQTELWAQWVRDKTDAFDEGNITVCQDFMKLAVFKQNKIIGKQMRKSNGSSSSVQEDIVAMFSKRTRSSTKRKTSDNDDSDKSPPKTTVPPFLRHFNHVSYGITIKYKVGDSKKWNDTTWYFCDCPKHRNRVKWHKYPADEYRLRKKWLEDKVKVEANGADVDDEDEAVAEIDDAYKENDPPTYSASNETASDPTILLASALNLLADNPIARDLVADALNAASDGE